MYGVVVGVFSFINLYAGPIALKNIQYNYVFVRINVYVPKSSQQANISQIFVGWDIIESVIWYFLCVETVGRTLEELEWVFDSPYPVRASTQLETVAIKRTGGVAIVDDS